MHRDRGCGFPGRVLGCACLRAQLWYVAVAGTNHERADDVSFGLIALQQVSEVECLMVIMAPSSANNGCAGSRGKYLSKPRINHLDLASSSIISSSPSSTSSLHTIVTIPSSRLPQIFVSHSAHIYWLPLSPQISHTRLARIRQNKGTQTASPIHISYESISTPGLNGPTIARTNQPTGRPTDRQTDRPTDRQRQTDRPIPTDPPTH